VRTLLFLASLSVLTADAVLGQSSVLASRGLGLPGRGVSARQRGSSGAFGLFDPESALNPAALGDIAAPIAGFTMTPEWRHWDNSAGSASLRDTRFPLAYVATPLHTIPLSLGFGVSSYADRDFRLATAGKDTLRGVPVDVFDTLGSTGGLNDLRFGVGFRLGDAWRIGGTVHIITGSSRVDSRRSFSDTSFLTVRQTAELSYAGVGFSLGAIRRLGPGLFASLLIRSDGKVNVDRDSIRAYTIDLPYTFGAGLMYRPSSRLQLGGQAIYRTWSAANSDLLKVGGIGAVNTLELSTGMELVTDSRRPSHRPIRLGLRYSGLPFPLTPGGKGHEFGISVGSGTRFARERAGVDLGVEHVWRSEGSSFKERALMFTFGISVRP
jgi:hypothetical protein